MNDQTAAKFNHPLSQKLFSRQVPKEIKSKGKHVIEATMFCQYLHQLAKSSLPTGLMLLEI